MISRPLLDSFSGEGVTFGQFRLPRQSVNPGFGAEQQSVGG